MHWSEKIANIGTTIGGATALIAVLIALQEVRSKEDLLDDYSAQMDRVMSVLQRDRDLKAKLFELSSLWPNASSPSLTVQEIWDHQDFQSIDLNKNELLEVLLVGLSNGLIRSVPSVDPFNRVMRLQWDFALSFGDSPQFPEGF